jgi:cell division septal protein FtsQ
MKWFGNEIQAEPDPEEYQPELPWRKMSAVRRVIFVAMIVATALWLGLLGWLWWV